MSTAAETTARAIDCEIERTSIAYLGRTVSAADLAARGVAVVCESTHSCMTMRRVRKPGSLCVTSAMRGIFRDDPKSRAEVLGLINREA